MSDLKVGHPVRVVAPQHAYAGLTGTISRRRGDVLHVEITRPYPHTLIVRAEEVEPLVSQSGLALSPGR